MFDDGLECTSGGFADAVALVLLGLDKTKVLEEYFDDSVAEGAGEVPGEVGVGLNVLFLLGESSPKLHGLDAVDFVGGVGEDGVDVLGQSLDVLRLDQ